MERVALYARVSTIEQAANGDSLRMQHEALEAFAKARSMLIVDTYTDDGYTATNLKRPALNRLLDDIRAGKIDRVLFVKLDRWSRGVRNYYKLADVLDAHSVKWQTVFENYDSGTAAGQLHINIMLSVAENESANTSERIKAVFKSKLKAGEVVTGAVPLGYRIENKRLVADGDSAETVRALFAAYLKCGTVKGAMAELAAQGRALSYNQARRMLENELYTGRHPSGVEGYCPALVSCEDFRTVGRMLAQRSPRKPGQPVGGCYSLKSICVCAECGRLMAGDRIEKNGRQYHYYRCTKATKDGSCGNVGRYSEAKIEKHLLENAKREIGGRVLAYEAKAKPRKADDAGRQAKALQAKLNRLRDLYIDELIDKESYKAKYEQLSGQLAALEAEAAKAGQPQDLEALKRFGRLDLAEVYETLTPGERRRLWLSVVDRIECGPERGRFEVIYK